MTGAPGPDVTRTAERPIVVRGGILMFGLIIVFSTVKRWLAPPVPDAPAPPIWLHVIPLVLASSMVVQFFALRRSSPLLALSLGLILVSLLLLWLFSAGHLG